MAEQTIMDPYWARVAVNISILLGICLYIVSVFIFCNSAISTWHWWQYAILGWPIAGGLILMCFIT